MNDEWQSGGRQLGVVVDQRLSKQYILGGNIMANTDTLDSQHALVRAYGTTPSSWLASPHYNQMPRPWV